MAGAHEKLVTRVHTAGLGEVGGVNSQTRIVGVSVLTAV